MLDLHKDKLQLIQEGNIKLSKSIITATEDKNIGQNIYFNMMRQNNHKFMKTYNMASSFKSNNAEFPPLPNCFACKPVSSVSVSLPFTNTAWSFLLR